MIDLSVEGLAFEEYVAYLRAKTVAEAGTEDDTAIGDGSSEDGSNVNGGVGGGDTGETIDNGNGADGV